MLAGKIDGPAVTVDVSPLVAGAIVADAVGVGDEMLNRPGTPPIGITYDVDCASSSSVDHLFRNRVNNVDALDVGVVIVEDDVLMHEATCLRYRRL